MKHIGERIRELRVIKGYSQEELADQSGLSVRTIHRIEKGETIPRGNTLHLLCDVFEVKVEDLATEKEVNSNSDQVIRTLYLLVLVGIVVPLDNILGPLIGWSMHRKESDTFDRVGKNIVLTQMVYTFFVTSLILYAVFNTLENHDDYTFEWLMGVGFILTISNYGLALYGGLKSEGQVYIPFFKVINGQL